MITLGIDPSTFTGLVRLDGEESAGKSVNFPKLKGFQRLISLRKEVQRTVELWKPDIVVIEGYAYGKTLVRVDAEAQKAVDAKRAEDMVKPVTEAYELYFKIVYSLFGVTPSAIYAGNIAKLSHRYPDGFFTTVSANAVKDTPKEVAVAKEAAAKSVKSKAKPKTVLKAVA